MGRYGTYNCWCCGWPIVGIFVFSDRLVGAAFCRTHALEMLPRFSSLKHWTWVDEAWGDWYEAELAVRTLARVGEPPEPEW